MFKVLIIFLIFNEVDTFFGYRLVESAKIILKYHIDLVEEVEMD